jgi:S-layer homology domain
MRIRIEIELPRFPRRLVRLLTALAVTVAVLAFPIWALASHQFSDVPDSNPFHGDISALADSGVTAGCGGGKFCPKDLVTREQMAAFMNRLGALSPGKTPVVNADKIDGLDSSVLARTDEVQHFSCMGSDLRPVSSLTEWAGGVGARYLTNVSSELLMCPMHLPDDATVLFLIGNAYDGTASAAIDCRMYRIDNEGNLITMATTTNSGVAATPGRIGVGTATITEPVIDNTRHAYSVGCSLGASSTFLYVTSVHVTYIGAP